MAWHGMERRNRSHARRREVLCFAGVLEQRESVCLVLAWRAGWVFCSHFHGRLRAGFFPRCFLSFGLVVGLGLVQGLGMTCLPGMPCRLPTDCFVSCREEYLAWSLLFIFFFLLFLILGCDAMRLLLLAMDGRNIIFPLTVEQPRAGFAVRFDNGMVCLWRTGIGVVL